MIIKPLLIGLGSLLVLASPVAAAEQIRLKPDPLELRVSGRELEAYSEGRTASYDHFLALEMLDSGMSEVFRSSLNTPYNLEADELSNVLKDPMLQHLMH